ncbi:hypothetical protein GCM10010399_48130 [Dactylosporangium fulvum]|uniref:Lipoprotein n=1 Tax=Dactylosporangium fulvum TaxID=53359 RepID=A0ABY5VRR0_9ACTN|nr:hypothetical protein [Dactylosporangium fulvum]UWP80462.1 hypothetical protein Dfulv_35625 [Dactylosporangium fulvum]
MLRVAPPVAALLVAAGALSGCNTPAESPPPAAKVTHTVTYELFHSGGPGLKIVGAYTDERGASVSFDTPQSTWTKQVDVVYPDVTTVVLGGNAAPDGDTVIGAQIPQLQCILWVDGSIVAQQHSLSPRCEAKLTGTVTTPKPGSPAPSASR